MKLLLSLSLLLCVTSPGFGQSDGDIRIPPKITQQSDDLVRVMKEDSKTTIECVASGEPTPEYEWKFNGQRLETNGPNIKPVGAHGSIEVQLSPLQEGGYQCFASNQYGKTMTDITYILRAVLAGFPPEEHTEYPVEEGESVVLKCGSTKSVPAPQYSWDTIESITDNPNSRPVQLNQRVKLDDEGNLYFSQVTKDDEQDGRLYRCVLTNTHYGGAQFGGYSKIIVNDAPGDGKHAPANLFHSGMHEGSAVVGIKGREITLQCIFSGNEVPSYSWQKKNGALPSGRYRYAEYKSILIIDDLRDSDEGNYECTGRNNLGTKKVTISVDIQSLPEFENTVDHPRDMNVTEGSNAVFLCDAIAEPTPEVEWYMNGDIIDENNAPERVEIDKVKNTLTVRDVCKDCADGSSDLRVYQCNTSNDHGYLFKAGYLNVLIPTTIDKLPVNVSLVYDEEVRFECDGDTDDSTPLEITWYKDNQLLYRKEDVISFVNGGRILVIVTDEIEESGLEYVGNYTCVLSNGYSSVNATASLIRPEAPPPDPVIIIAGGYWWIGLIVGLLLLLIILLLVCCLCCQRNRGDSYPVDEKERQNGNDPEKELLENGFQDYQRPDDQPTQGSRASLSSAMKLDSDDDESLAEYGDVDMGRFNEDGSFIGQYNTADRRRAANQSTV